MEFALVIVVLLVVGSFIYGLATYGDPGIQHANKLGDVRGKTLQEIVDVIGLPQSYSRTGAARLLVQWINRGTHAAMLFQFKGDGDSGDVDGNRSKYVCMGITHQFQRKRF